MAKHGKTNNQAQGARRNALPSLRNAPWLAGPGAAKVFAALLGASGQTRAVGGAVRDALLGRPVMDVDFATTILPEKVMARAKSAGLKAVPTGLEHGTVTLIADGASFEVTTLRRDVKTDGRHAAVRFTKDWTEDAKRRDFTLNALYAGPDGTLFDPLGGYGDLLSGEVRFIGDAAARIREDYLRILRFFRFNASYGNGVFDSDGLAACVRERAGLRRLSAERIASELKRLLVAPRAVEAVEVLFENGLICDILGSVPRLCRLARLIEIEAALEAPASVSSTAIVRLAALSVFVPEDAKRLAARFRLSNAEQAILALGGAPFDEGLSHEQALPNEPAARRLLYGLGTDRFRVRAMLAWAEAGAPANDPRWHAVVSLPQRWQAPAFPLRGPDITALGAFSGPAIGAMLRAVEQRWIEGGFAEDRRGLLARAKALAASASDSPKD